MFNFKVMTKKLILSIALLLPVTLAYSQHYNDIYGKPIVVLTVTNPWLMVIGSDVPSFALYDNGRVIYKKIIGRQVKYYEGKTDHEKQQLILNDLKITDSLKKLPKQITASTSTDQPYNMLILNLDSMKTIGVYGNLKASNVRSNTSKAFVAAYNAIMDFTADNAKEWMPDSIEVMLSGYSYAPEKSAIWPANWPDLKNPATMKRGDDLYSIYLDKKYFDDFIKLISSLKEKQALEVNGKKFSVSYRLPFPNIR